MLKHSIDKNYSPVSFGNFFVKNSVLSVNLYNLRNSDEYFIPRVDNESLRRFPFFDLYITTCTGKFIDDKYVLICSVEIKFLPQTLVL